MSKSRKCILLNSSLTGEDPRICLSCKKGRMVRKGELSPVRNLLVRKEDLSAVINSPPKEIV